MPLFEVAMLEEPTPKQEEEGKSEKLVFGPTAVVARDPQTAGLVAIQGKVPEGVDLSRVKVLVRPFV